jgi:hypothetical protein
MEIPVFLLFSLVKYYKRIITISFLFVLNSCSDNTPGSVQDTALKTADTTAFQKAIDIKKKLQAKTIHVFVALCDNEYQGIVKVPAAIGNGQDEKTNLYWGAAYGVKTYFSKSSEWNLIEAIKNPATNILERILFKHKAKKIYLLADAYDGQFIKQATIDYLLACSGKGLAAVKNNGNEIPFGGAADIIAYTGHDGLMDFSLPGEFNKQNNEPRKAIMLACKSKQYFSSHIKQTGAAPLLWTTGLMAPEAYILHAALDMWLKSGNAAETRIAAAAAYSRYQKCSIKAAQNLLVSGW